MAATKCGKREEKSRARPDLVVQITTLFALLLLPLEGIESVICAAFLLQYFHSYSLLLPALFMLHAQLHSVPAVVSKFALELQRECERERERVKQRLPISLY